SSGQLDSQTITGPIHQQVTQALQFVVRNMRVAAHKAPARIDLRQYSIQAVFEALVNAVAHRDYSIRTSRIRISMFSDRLEIYSPGNLPNNLTIQGMTERQATRNEVLTSALGRIPVPELLDHKERQFFLERRGDGVPIIVEKTHELSGLKPEYKLIDNTDLLLIIPSARLDTDPDRASIVVECEGQPLAGVEVLALFPNKTYKQAITSTDGTAYIDLHSTHLPMTVFTAITGYTAGHETEWVPADGPLQLKISPLPGGGSAIFPNSSGNLPNVAGGLNPIMDTLNRTYLYTHNISINHGLQQPVNFAFNEELLLTDANGREALLRVVNIVGQAALLQYQTPPRP
ncbi:MAG: hypothetical protein OXE93_03330, partial [bacterium]|nr:hypothetical protein [bacterium]